MHIGNRCSVTALFHPPPETNYLLPTYEARACARSSVRARARRWSAATAAPANSHRTFELLAGRTILCGWFPTLLPTSCIIVLPPAVKANQLESERHITSAHHLQLQCCAWTSQQVDDPSHRTIVTSQRANIGRCRATRGKRPRAPTPPEPTCISNGRARVCH